MALKIISQRQRVSGVSHSLCFYYHGTEGGYGFDCDKDGNVDVLAMTELGLQSYKECLADNGETMRSFVREEPWAYWEPAVALCKCGEEIALEGDTECEKCHRLYNCWGQELAPREQWGYETGETLADIYSSRDPEEIR
jgi:hypothetical protein